MAKPTFALCVLFVVRSIDSRHTMCVCVRDRVAVGCVVDVTVATMSQVGVRIFSFFYEPLSYRSRMDL